MPAWPDVSSASAAVIVGSGRTAHGGAVHTDGWKRSTNGSLAKWWKRNCWVLPVASSNSTASSSPSGDVKQTMGPCGELRRAVDEVQRLGVDADSRLPRQGERAALIRGGGRGGRTGEQYGARQLVEAQLSVRKAVARCSPAAKPTTRRAAR